MKRKSIIILLTSLIFITSCSKYNEYEIPEEANIEIKDKLVEVFKTYKLYDFIGFKPIKRYSCVYRLAEQLDKIGLKLRYWAEMLQKKEVKKLKIS